MIFLESLYFVLYFVFFFFFLSFVVVVVVVFSVVVCFLLGREQRELRTGFINLFVRVFLLSCVLSPA